jgi:hypothetical protein
VTDRATRSGEEARNALLGGLRVREFGETNLKSKKGKNPAVRRKRSGGAGTEKRPKDEHEGNLSCPACQLRFGKNRQIGKERKERKERKEG